MSQIQIPPYSPDTLKSTLTPQLSFAVEMKSTWSGAWVRQNYIEALSAMDCVAPSIGRAAFLLKYGMNKREDSTQFIQEYDIEALEQYIRVVKLDSQSSLPLWTGVIDVERLQPWGGAKGSGNESFEAFGLCHFLMREKIRKVKAACADGTNSYVDIVPKANVRFKKGVQTFGNRSNQTDSSDGAYVFSTDGAQWSNLDLVNMILARHTPANGPTFVLGGQTSVLDTIHGVYELYDKTPWECLNELISRSRGLGFAPIVGASSVVLYVYTILEEDFAFGNMQIPANDNQITIDLDNSLDIVQSSIVYNAATKFERIEVQGAPMLTCFTISYPDKTLENAWTASDITNYKNAAGGSDPFANDEYRKDEIFTNVYAKRRIPRTFTGMVGDGTGGPQVNCLPVCGDDGTVTVPVSTPPPFFPLGKCFEQHLPFQEGADYSVNPPTFNGQPNGAEPIYMKPFALVQDPNVSTKYYWTHNPGENFPNAAAHLKVHPREMAIGIEASHRYIYGKGDFDATPLPNAYLYTPLFSPSSVLATVSMRTDQRLKVVATAENVNAGDRIRTKTIDITKLNRRTKQDDEFFGGEYWYVVPGTVIGLNTDGSLKRYVGSGVLRDDTSKLREICAFASVWYGRTRASMGYTRKTIEVVPLGALVVSSMTGAVERIVGTPVTSVGYDFGENPTMNVQTQWAEIDYEGGNG